MYVLITLYEWKFRLSILSSRYALNNESSHKGSLSGIYSRRTKHRRRPYTLSATTRHPFEYREWQLSKRGEHAAAQKSTAHSLKEPRCRKGVMTKFLCFANYPRLQLWAFLGILFSCFLCISLRARNAIIVFWHETTISFPIIIFSWAPILLE